MLFLGKPKEEIRFSENLDFQHLKKESVRALVALNLATPRKKTLYIWQ